MSIRRVVPLLATVLFAGCFHIEETMTLKKDGSGKIHMEVVFPQLAMRFLPGKPSVDWVRPNLPDGVGLTSFANALGKTPFTDANGKTHTLVSELYECDLSFDNVAALNDIRVRPDTRNATAASAGATPGKGVDSTSAQNDNRDVGPFQELTLVQESDLLHFRRVVQAARDPDDIETVMMSAPGAAIRSQPFDLGDSMLRITIVCPGDVTEHNAHRVAGHTLTWEFNMKELQERQDRDWIVRFTCRRDGKS